MHVYSLELTIAGPSTSFNHILSVIDIVRPASNLYTSSYHQTEVLIACSLLFVAVLTRSAKLPALEYLFKILPKLAGMYILGRSNRLTFDKAPTGSRCVRSITCLSASNHSFVFNYTAPSGRRQGRFVVISVGDRPSPSRETSRWRR
jgi:hypothetical protein